jgi:hypothetical protein
VHTQSTERLAAEVRWRHGREEGFWVDQQNRLRAIREADPALTDERIGELVGKSSAWVGAVLAWDPASLRPPTTPEGG